MMPVSFSACPMQASPQFGGGRYAALVDDVAKLLTNSGFKATTSNRNGTTYTNAATGKSVTLPKSTGPKCALTPAATGKVTAALNLRGDAQLRDAIGNGHRLLK
jgi:hypothetical protein